MPIPQDAGFLPPKLAVATAAQQPVCLPQLQPPPPPVVRSVWFGDGFSATPATCSMKPPPVVPNWPAGPLAPNGQDNANQVNPDVETMQHRLADLGYLDADQLSGAWGKYGPRTTEATADFQLANGLPVTGSADTTTLERMGASTARTEEQAVEALGQRNERVIGQRIGTWGPQPKPAPEEHVPEQRTIAYDDVNCRESPVNGTPKDQFSKGTTVTEVEPQPEGGQDGWMYVTGQGQHGEVSGWVKLDRTEEIPKTYPPQVDTRLQELGYLPPDGTTDSKAVKNFQAMNKDRKSVV